MKWREKIWKKNNKKQNEQYQDLPKKIKRLLIKSTTQQRTKLMFSVDVMGLFSEEKDVKSDIFPLNFLFFPKIKKHVLNLQKSEKLNKFNKFDINAEYQKRHHFTGWYPQECDFFRWRF